MSGVGSAQPAAPPTSQALLVFVKGTNPRGMITNPEQLRRSREDDA